MPVRAPNVTHPGQPRPRPDRFKEGGLVLGMAIAPAVSGFVALICSAIGLLSGGGSFPRGLVLVIMMQAGVASVLYLSERNPLTKSWIAVLACSAALLPLLALQVALLHEPYVSWARQSASPALVATVVVGMIVVVGAVFSVATSWEHPDEAGLLFLPQALMVPAMIGMHSTVSQGPSLRMFGVVMVLAAAATAAGWLVQPAIRLFVPAGGLAVEVIGLWVSGHGPWFQETSGGIVRVLYGAMLALAVLLVVAVPFAAMWVNHGARVVRAAGNVRRRPANPRPPMSRGPVIPR